MCITEKKFKKIVGQLWLGKNDSTWMGDVIDQAVKSRNSGEFFKHRRDGYKALHVIRRSNKHGMFLEISEFHSGSRQGVIRIPEGAERQGWVHFSKLCKGFMAPTCVPQRNNPMGRDMERRKREAGVAGLNWEREEREPCISQTYGNNVTATAKPVEGVMAKDMVNVPLNIQTKPIVNACVELVLKLELVCGPSGHWDVSWAKVTNTTGGAQTKTGNPETQRDNKKWAMSLVHKLNKSGDPNQARAHLRVTTHRKWVRPYPPTHLAHSRSLYHQKDLPKPVRRNLSIPNVPSLHPRQQIRPLSPPRNERLGSTAPGWAALGHAVDSDGTTLLQPLLCSIVRLYGSREDSSNGAGRGFCR